MLRVSIKTRIKALLQHLPVGRPKLRLAEQLALLASRSLPASNVDRFKGIRTLTVGMRGDVFSNLLESFFTHAFIQRGTQSEVLVCDSALPLCNATRITRGLTPPCDSCVCTSTSVYSGLGLPVVGVGSLLGPEDTEAAREISRNLAGRLDSSYVFHGVDIGDIAESSVYSFMLTAKPPDDEITRNIHGRMLQSAALMVLAGKRICESRKPDIAFSSHGVYTNWGAITRYFVSKGIPTYIWGRGYRKNTIIITRDEHWQTSLYKEPESVLSGIALSASQRKTTEEYLESRRTGENDFIQYNPKPSIVDPECHGSSHISASSQLFVAFPNIAWDAADRTHAVNFCDMNDWLISTIKWFASHANCRLIVRVHPAEVRLDIKTTVGVVALVKEHFGDLPSNVEVIGPEETHDSYSLAESADAALVYSSKLGLELAARGKVVVVAGRPFYRDKGFTTDPESRDEYFTILTALSNGALPSVDKAKALRYAYHYFLNVYRPFGYVDVESPGDLRLTALEDLLPGRNAGFDELCDGMLSGKQYIYPVGKTCHE